MQVVYVGLIAAVVACTPAGEYHCVTNAQCARPGKTELCRPEGVCAFADTACESGSRYDDSAGALGGECVPVPADWLDPAWTARFPLTITNSATTALPAGYQVAVPVAPSAAPCLGDDDLRFGLGTTELARVIDHYGAQAIAWLPLHDALASGATTTAYAMYCGNPAHGTAPADPHAVFGVFDPFDDVTLTGWMQNNAITVAGGSVTIGNNGSPASIVSVAKYGPGSALDVLATASPTPYFFGFENGTTKPQIRWFSSAVGTVTPLVDDSLGNPGTTQAQATGTGVHLYSVDYATDRATFRYDNANAQEVVFTNAPSPADLSVRLGSSSGSTVTVDAMRMRFTAAPAPSVVLGAVESY